MDENKWLKRACNFYFLNKMYYNKQLEREFLDRYRQKKMGTS
jgi:hypothetical protein